MSTIILFCCRKKGDCILKESIIHDIYWWSLWKWYFNRCNLHPKWLLLLQKKITTCHAKLIDWYFMTTLSVLQLHTCIAYPGVNKSEFELSKVKSLNVKGSDYFRDIKYTCLVYNLCYFKNIQFIIQWCIFVWTSQVNVVLKTKMYRFSWTLVSEKLKRLIGTCCKVLY